MKVLPKKPKQTSPDPTTSDFTDDLFSNYTMTPLWEEAFLMATSPEQAVLNTPEPIIMKEENKFDSFLDINIEVNDASPPPPEANAIAENNIELETYAFSSQESEDLDDCWGLTSFHALLQWLRTSDLIKMKLTEKAKLLIFFYNMDIVQFALDDFLLTEKAHGTNILVGAQEQEQKVLAPKVITASFIHPNNNFITTNHTTISLILPAMSKILWRASVEEKG